MDTFDESFVRQWSSAYMAQEMASGEEELLFNEVGPAIIERGYLTTIDLLRIGNWKAARATGYLNENSEGEVLHVSRIALTESTPDWMRHGILCILRGVGHPMASALLTVSMPTRFSILDYRVLEALQRLHDDGQLWNMPRLSGKRGSLPTYWPYSKYLDPIRERLDVSFRDLDRALWKWHKTVLEDQ